MSVSGKFIDVGHSKVFDTGVLYAKAMDDIFVGHIGFI